MSIEDLPLKNERVLMRVDFNVPIKNGKITDDSRIKAALPTIQYALHHGASVILMSHLGRPNGKRDPQFTLKPCAERLSERLGKPVLFAPDSVGPEVEKMAHGLRSGQVLLLENLRFHPGEEEPEKEPEFVKKLAKLGTVYINDAFGTAHRVHASTALIATYFPHKAAAGLLMKKEISFLSPLLHNPKRPFYAIIGGAKVSTKAGVIQNLLKKVDRLFIGGGMTYTFLKAKGIEIGDSLFEATEVETVKNIMRSSSSSISLPLDLVIADAFDNGANRKTIPSNEPIPKGWRGMDIGSKTIQAWSAELGKANTVFWNGPLGVFEMAHFATGTHAIAEALSHSKAQVIIGGGDSVAAIEQMGIGDRFAHLSTGGGAALEFLEFSKLPGIESLTDIN
jgi:phosphoglycerate kinase